MTRRSGLVGPLSLAAWSVLGLLFAGCRNDSVVTVPHAHPDAGTVTGTYQGKYPIAAVCTTGMVADVVREVGGAHMTVVQLMKDGTDPHLYKATTHDVDQLAAADVIFLRSAFGRKDGRHFRADGAP